MKIYLTFDMEGVSGVVAGMTGPNPRSPDAFKRGQRFSTDDVLAAIDGVLEVDPDYCEAKKSLGYAYFGELCTQNFSRALTYLTQALDCNVKAGTSRGDDISLLLWIAQTYHFRAVERQEAKQPKEQYQKDYENADNFYREVLRYQPNNQEAKDGYRQVKWEH